MILPTKNMRQLSDICLGLEADKVTDRKKASENLLIHLEKTAFLKQLDKNTDEKQSIKWSNLFKSVCRFILKETDHQLQLNEKRSQTSSRRSYTPSTSSLPQLFRQVIHFANREVMRIHSDLIEQQILIILDSEYLMNKYGSDFSSVLLTEILMRRRMWIHLSSRSCQKLLQFFCDLFPGPPEHWNEAITAQIIEKLIYIMFFQHNINMNTLYKFFTFVLDDKMKRKSGSILDPLLSATALFVGHMAPNYRIQTCKLGEDATMQLLQVWKTCPRDLTKSHIVRFLHYQMAAHHPHGSKTEKEGAYACDWSTWKMLLLRIHEVLQLELLQVLAYKKAYSRADIDDSEIVNLAADVCHQIFSESSPTSIDISQSASTTLSASAAKRRKVEFTLPSLLENLKDMSSKIEVLPRLKMFNALIKKYGNLFSNEVYLNIIQAVNCMLTECRLNEIMRWLLILAGNLSVTDFKYRRKLNAKDKSTADAIWKNILDFTMKIIGLNNCMEESYMLIEALTNSHSYLLASCDILPLFMPNSHHKISNEALYVLSSLLRSKCIFQQYNSLPNTGAKMHTVEPRYHIRMLLIEWLLPNQIDSLWMIRNKIEPTFSNNKSSKNQYFCSPSLIAELLCHLCLKDTSTVTAKQKEDFVTVFDSQLKCLQDSYMETTFNVPGIFERIEHKAKSPLSAVNGTSIATVKAAMLGLVIKDCSATLEICYHMEIEKIKILSYQCCFVMCFTQSILKHGIMNLPEIQRLPLTNMLENMMDKLGCCLKEIMETNKSLLGNASHLVAAMDYLVEMVKIQDDLDICFRKPLTGYWRQLTPIRIIECMFDLLKQNNKNSKSPSKQQTRIRSNSDGSEDELFLTKDSTCEDSFEDEPDENANFNETHFDFSCQSENEIEKLRLLAAKFLSSWCAYSGFASPNLDPMGMTEHQVLADVFELCCEQLDINNFSDLKLTMLFLKSFTKKRQNLNQNYVTKILERLRNILKAHEKDKEVISHCIDILSQVVYHVSKAEDFDESENLQSNRKRLMFLLNIFWPLKNKMECSTSVHRSLLTCSTEILKHNKENWAEFLCDKTDEGKDVVSISERFIWFFTLKIHSIRKLAIKNCWLMLCHSEESGIYELQTPEYQQTIINMILSALEDLVATQDKSSSEAELSDLTVGKLSSILLCCGTLLAMDCYRESNILLFLCRIIHLNSVDCLLVEKVLNQVTFLLNYSSTEEFMKQKFKFLIHQWLKDHPLSKFPFQLLKCDSLKTFYRMFSSFIVPELVFSENLNTLQEVAKQLKMEVKELVKNHLAFIIALILPYDAAKSGAKLKFSQDYERSAESSLNFIFEIFSLEVIKETVDKEAPNVLLYLLNLYESVDEIQVHNTNLCPSQMHSFSEDTLSKTISYLISTYYKNSTRLFIQMLFTKHDSIQQILLPLCSAMIASKKKFERRRLFSMYRMFVKLLCSEFSESHFKKFVPFFLRDTVFNLAYHLRVKLNDFNFSSDVIDLLHEICGVAVNSCSEELSKYLSVILAALIPLVSQDDIISSKASAVIKLLIVENNCTLNNAISLLDPFPPSESFTEFEEVLKAIKYKNGPYSLNQELEHFLKGRKCNSLSHRVEGLDHLLFHLQTKKDELKQLTERFQGERMFSEDVANNNIHQVICELMKLSSQRIDTQVSISASKCLGEIGPIDLSSIVLSSNVVSDEMKWELDPEFYCIFLILKSLNSYLIDEDVKVKCVAAAVLNTLMSTKILYKFTTTVSGTEFDDLFCCLQPFMRSKNTETPSKKRHGNSSIVDDKNLWTPEHDDHEEWVVNLVCALVKSGLTQDEVFELDLEPICKMKPDFCEKILPFVIHKILLKNDENVRSTLSGQISRFFKEHCQSVDNDGHVNQNSSSTIVCFERSVQAMINVVQYLRTQKRNIRGTPTPWANNFWLDVDYLDIAQAARFCSTHFASILFTEIWIEDDYMSNSSISTEDTSQETQSTSKIEKIDVNKTALIQKIMSDAYSSIGELDSVYGCRFSSQIQISDRIKRYELENNWGKLISAYDLDLSAQLNVNRQAGMLQMMQKFGFNHLFETYLKGASSTKDERFQKFQYECAWRNGMWEIPNDQSHSSSEYHQLIYKGFCDLQENDTNGFYKVLEDTRLCVSSSYKNSELISSCSVYSNLSRLQCIAVFEEALKLVSESKFLEISEKWTLNDSLWNNNFEFVEPVLMIQCTTLKLLKEKSRNPLSVLRMLQERLQTLSKFARQAGHYQVAEKCLHNLRHMHKSDGIEFWQFQLEEAELMWAKSEVDAAKQLLKSLLHKILKTNQLDTEINKFYPRALTIYGKWLAETCSESPSVIMEEFFDKSVMLLDGRTDSEKLPMIDTYLTLARYADLQYQNIYDRFKSPTYQTKCELIERSRQEFSRLKSLSRPTRTEMEALNMHRKHIQFDESELKALHQDKSDFLSKSIQNYIHCLRLGSDYVLPIFRLISLWFQNSSSAEVSELINKTISCIPTYKFLPLMHQLAARISVNDSQGEIFQETLQKMIIETTVDHPYHTLLIIFALANAPKDLMYDNDLKVAASRSRGQSSKNDNRVNAALSILKKVSDRKHLHLVSGLKAMCNSYIQFAYMQTDKKNKVSVRKIPSTQSILKLNHSTRIPVPTANIEVDKSGEYLDVPCIKEIGCSYEVVGGVNEPKKIKCLGTDGKIYRQLVKGKDDLRQDAVMQQFFSLVNNLLKQDPETKKRKLSMRTYKVIPLSQRSGILQWCNGTQPFSEYLCGSKPVKGAHQIYHPTNFDVNKCTSMMNSVARSNNKIRLNIYSDICRNFKPVFHHFFLENFPEPAVWFERRLAYTQSVATCSVVGYILGLGDRHVHNILIDKRTAEFIHIDLGIAFEQGKLLPTPEMVPFRLTRDVVDGMGIMGVEGVFRRCCEKTMKVMHSSQEVLLTIPQVLLYDPLYKWLVSQEKVAKVQGNNGSPMNSTQEGLTSSKLSNVSILNDDKGPAESNKVAERVLLRLKEKLQGVEKGTAMSVGGQVNHLIQEAMDPNNLSRMFPGWKPFL